MDYKNCSIAAIYLDNQKPLLLNVPTACNRVNIIAGIINEHQQKTDKKILVMTALREILINQYSEYIKNYCMANLYDIKARNNNQKYNVTFAPAYTVLNRIEDFHDFGLIIVDESINSSKLANLAVEKIKLLINGQ